MLMCLGKLHRAGLKQRAEAWLRRKVSRPAKHVRGFAREPCMQTTSHVGNRKLPLQWNDKHAALVTA